MRTLVQRVSQAFVSVDDKIVGKIDKGLMILLGVKAEDSQKEIDYLAGKCANLRVFPDENGNMNRSLLDVGGEALIVSQFTLYGNTAKGRRPSFIEAAPPEIAEPIYKDFVAAMEKLGIKCQTGVFGAMMLVEIHNDGPVTLMLESK